MMLSQIPIIVINLKKDLEKRKKITERLKHFGLKFSFFDAFYGNDLSINELKKSYNSINSLQRNCRELRSNEVGCALSHFGVYELMIQKGIEEMLIFEDDAVLSENFLESLKVIDLLPKSWEIFLLGYSSNRKFPCSFKLKLENNKTNFSVGISPSKRACLHGYVINQRGAKRMLSYKESLYQPIDYYSGDNRLMNVFVLVPRVVFQDANLESSIGYKEIEDRKSWKNSKLISLLRDMNNQRRHNRVKGKKFSLNCFVKKIKYLLRHKKIDFYE